MQEDKAWYQSRSVWGGVVALGAALAGLVGVGVDTASNEVLVTALSNGAAAAGAVVAILGRLAAQKSIR